MELNLKGRAMAAYKGWRNPYGQSHTMQQDLLSWDEHDERMARYEFGWKSYENRTYNDITAWMRAYKVKHALYEYIDDIYNPTNYIVNFAKTYVWGGRLDMQAGDGTLIKSALPIETEKENLRPVIAEIWKWSQWQKRKDIVVTYGAAMGDYGLKVIDKPETGRVYMDVVHPATISQLIMDDFGNIKAYMIEDVIEDPRDSSKTVRYKETCEHGDGANDIIYRTYLDDKRFDYVQSGDSSWEWVEQYGFVPLVAGQHINIGRMYGQTATYAAESKIRQADNLATQLAAHTSRKTNEIYFQTGSQAADLTIAKSTPTADNPQPNKTKVAVLFGGKEGSIEPLTSDINEEGILEEIREILKGMAREYPEMKLDDAAEVVGAKSGAALRVLQDPATNKMQEVRVNYDPVLVTAQQMAMSIGALGDYPVYSGLPVDGYANGDFEHSIAERDVFKPDKTEQLIQSNFFWDAVTKAATLKIPLPVILEKEGWTEREIDVMLEKMEEAENAELRQNRRNGNINTRTNARNAAQTAAQGVDDTIDVVEEQNA